MSKHPFPCSWIWLRTWSRIWYCAMGLLTLVWATGTAAEQADGHEPGAAQAGAQSRDMFHSTAQFGVYGRKWTPWVLKNHGLIGLHIYQMPFVAGPEHDKAVGALLETGLDIVAMQPFYYNSRHRFMRLGAPDDRPAAEVTDQIARNFSHPNLSRIPVLTLDEENFWWRQRPAYLSTLYHAVKTRLPGRQVWQWFSDNDNMDRLRPVEARFSIPADGYVFDPYAVALSDYEERVRGYVDQGKPLIAILWASANWAHGYRHKGRQDDWWNKTGWRRLFEKTMTNRRYGIRTVYFIYDLPYHNDDKRPLTPGYASEDPCSRAFVRKFFGTTLPRLAALPLDAQVPETRPDWMAERCPTE